MGWLAVLGTLAITVILIACNGSPAPTATSAPTPAPMAAEVTPTPRPTTTAALAPSPVPTAAPSPTATPVLPTATPIPTATPVQPTATPTPDITQAPSEPGPGLTGEQMAAIMLTQEDIDTEFPSLEFDPDTSGFADNADAAEDTFDPDDIEADITAAGRITGYEHEFADFSSILGGSWEGPLAMVTAIHVLEDEASASAYLTMLAEEPMRFADAALDGGTLRSSAPLTPGTILGEESAGFQTEMEVTELDSSFLMYGALWRRGSAVLLIYLVGAPGMEPGESVWRLAARMDDRVAPALAGKITAVPLAAAFQELEPVPGEDTTELEQRALAQGYDLRALTDLSGLLPGFRVSSESFSLDGTEIGFERDYEPDSISAPVGDSTVMMVGTDFDLFETEFEAAATMGIISAMDPETWADLFALGLASEMGADVDSVEVEKLEVPGKDVTGFSASFGFLQFHMYFVAGGRLAGLVMMMGTELRAEDTMPLAAEIKNRAAVPPAAVVDDHGNSMEKATAVTAGGVVDGALDYEGDVDFFMMEAEEGTSYHIEVNVGSLKDYVTTLYDSGGEFLGVSVTTNAQGGRPFPRLLEAEKSGSYYVAVDGGLDNATGSYTLSVTQLIMETPIATPTPVPPARPAPEPTPAPRATPTPATGVETGSFVSISAGEEHTCGVKTGGSVACWGNNDNGQSTPPAGFFTSVGSGDDHTCGVKTGGSVVCWGDNSFDQSAPPAGSFTSVSAGFSHTCGVKTDGSVACWGYDGGEGRATPPGGSFTSISAGSWHTCGIKTSGSVACWGKNDDGESTPPAGSFTVISAGVWYTCGVKTGGSIVCWGSNSLGQATPSGGSFTSVSAGFHHTCGVKTDGSIACWGYNDYDGRVTPPSGSFTAISAGDDHTCGVKTDGSVVCWGSNEYGQATPTPTPPTSTPTGDATSDRAVLVALYNAVDAPGWVFENWLSDAPLGEWEGVTTDANGRVTGLDLGVFLLDGEIPPELGRLSSLEVLNLWGNGFSGRIPSELGNLANLRELYLWSNELSGEIPPDLGNLTKLTTMQLEFNQLSGEIPPELGKLSSLEKLWLYENQLSGEIPSELGNLSSLTWLNLSQNRLSGAIPAELGNLPNLLFLYLADNQFTGCVPASVGNVLISDIEELGLPPC